MKVKTNFLMSALLAACLPALLLASAARAQTPAPKSDAMPTAAVVVEPYQSAFKNYQSYNDEKMIDWKAANDTTAHIGGWREYARQAQQPENTPTPDMKSGEVAPKVKP